MKKISPIIYNRMVEFYNRNKPFIILFLGYYMIELLFYRMAGDDLTLAYATQGLSPIDEIKIAINEYYSWGARIFVDSVLRVILHYKWLWKIVNALLFTLIGKMISLLLEIKNENANWIVVALLFAYPQEYSMSAGWAVTSMTYIWTIAIGLLFVYCLKVMLHGQLSKGKMFVLFAISTILLVYSADVEQMALIMVLILIAIFVLNIRIKQKWIILWYWAVSVAMLIFHLCVPGNQARVEQEIANWFPDFAQLSFIHKVEIGISSTLNEFVFNYNTAFFLMTLFIMLIIFNKYQEKIYRVVAIIPFAFSLFFGLLKPVLSTRYDGFYSIANIMDTHGKIDFTKCELWIAYLPLFLMLFCGICVAWGVYLSINSNRQVVLLCVLLVASLGACVAIGLSPTVWASRTRTTTCFYFAVIIICCALVREAFQMPNNEKEKKIVGFVSLLTAIVGIGDFIMRLY